ncbi:hypothetical protein CHS0354_002521 [Potamilus streckersoni]|uniref:Protein fem-1 homolog B n=1 Tax=Potamilus streckersoni TaxID=2493646 RepID=A0AAE0VZZ5_9BIVA|nr:hypothetical protein CHS0354_002521 [Potamilus streckersoni]
MNILKVHVEDLKKKFYVAAKDGRTGQIISILANWSANKEICNIINHQTAENGQSVSPLLIAIIHGHENIVYLLLNIPETDFEQGGSIWIEKTEIKDARPLWCAAALNHFSIVKLLVEYRADIEGATETRSTPLRVACYNGNLEIVKYLVGRGANVNSSNSWGHACLMTAAYNGHVETVKYLLENGAETDKQDNLGRTAFHYASERGHMEVLKVLLSSGTTAKDVKDNLSFTPIMRAAENAQCNVVEFLISESIYSREESIQALELLGSRLSIPDKNDLQSAINYYRKAMDLRYSNSSDTIPKINLVPITAHDNHLECKTTEELDPIKTNELFLHMETLAIREKILGPTHKEFIRQLKYLAATYADNNKYNVSIAFLKHVASSNQIRNKSMYKILELLVEMTIDLIKTGFSLVFSEVVDLFQLVVYELKKNKERKDDNNVVERNMKTCLLCIGIYLQSAKEDKDARSLRTLIKQVIHLDPRLKDGSTLLHVTVSSTDTTDVSTDGEITFPNASLCTLLIQCGADVNCLDAKRNTPLHTICQLHHSCVDVHTLRTIIKAMLRAGAHADVINTDDRYENIEADFRHIVSSNNLSEHNIEGIPVHIILNQKCYLY